MKTAYFINPPSGLYRRDDRCQSRVEDQTVNVVFPPMELALYAAVARRAGWSAQVRDYPAMGASWEDCRRELQSARPDALLINTTSATAAADIEAARALKSVHPGALTLARGEYLRYDAARILTVEADLDLICWGEVEAVLPDLLKLTEPGKEPRREWSAIPGVAFRMRAGATRDPDARATQGGALTNVFISSERPIVKDLDALPLPARDLLDHRLYLSPETGNPISVISANRGCPSHCIFCPAGALSNYRVRFRSPVAIVDELRECVERHGIREFLFNGDTFTIKKSWLIELCRGICDAGLDIRWGCNSRVDTMDDERAQWLRRAGCWVVAFGVESGSQQLLDRMGKSSRVERAFEAVAAVRRAGLAAHTFFIVGLPWETRQTLAETFDMVRRLDPDFFDFNVAYPLPGTELWEIARRDGLFEGSAPSESSYARAALRSYELSGAELTQWRRRALLRLYLRPRYILRTLRAAARSPRVLRNYVRAAVRRLRSLVHADGGAGASMPRTAVIRSEKQNGF